MYRVRMKETNSWRGQEAKMNEQLGRGAPLNGDVLSLVKLKSGDVFWGVSMAKDSTDFIGSNHPSAVKSDFIISSVKVEHISPSHAHLGVWNRGGKSGSLVVNADDAGKIISLLLGGVCFPEQRDE